MPNDEFEAAVRDAFRAFNERRFDDFATYVTEDVVERYPQSGEWLQGRERQLAFHKAFPDPPTFTIVAVRRDGDLAVVEAEEHYPDGSIWNDVWILELRDGLVSSMTGYFGEPFAAPAWRAAFVSTTG